jgi:hypothetical protein
MTRPNAVMMPFFLERHLLVEDGQFMFFVLAIFDHGKDVGCEAAQKPNQAA